MNDDHLFEKVVDGSDIIIEVLDARDPLGCRCPQVEETVLTSGKNKKIILLLNKIDLIPRDNLDRWLKYLRNEFPTVAFRSSTQSQRDRLVNHSCNSAFSDVSNIFRVISKHQSKLVMNMHFDHRINALVLQH